MSNDQDLAALADRLKVVRWRLNAAAIYQDSREVGDIESALRQHAERERERIESAFKEGWRAGHSSALGKVYDPDRDWEISRSRKALESIEEQTKTGDKNA